MKAVIRRLNRFEDRLGTKKPRNVFRLVVTRSSGDDSNLEKATCKRHYAGGLLTEVIDLKGYNNPFTSEEPDDYLRQTTAKPPPAIRYLRDTCARWRGRDGSRRGAGAHAASARLSPAQCRLGAGQRETGRIAHVSVVAKTPL